MNEKTAIIYLRVSSAQQAERELPIESQLQAAQKKAGELGARVLKVFTDSGISGRSDKRQDFQDAVTYCEIHKPDYFIAWDTARFARNRIDAAIYKRDLRSIGTDVVYASVQIDSTTDEGWLMEAFLEIMDENTSRRISKDTKRSMIKNASEGYFNGGRVSFGYATVPEDKRKRLVVNEDEARIVRRMFEMAGDGAGAHTIAVNLNQAGITHRGRRWARTNVLHTLKNAIYTGYTIFNRRRHHAAELEPEENWIRTKSHPAIIDEPTFDRIQYLIGARAPAIAGGAPRSHHLFTGLMHCGRCESPMYCETGTSRTKTTYYYYRCSNVKSKLGCDGPRYPADVVDDFVNELVLDEVLTRDRVMFMVREVERAAGTWWKDREFRRKAIVAEMRDVEKRRKNLFQVLELHGKDAPNLADLTVRLRELKDQIEAFEMELFELEAQSEPELFVDESRIANATDTLRALVKACEDPLQVRAFYSTFVKKVEMQKERVVVIYDPSKLMNHKSIAVHSENIWLPDLFTLRTTKVSAALPLSLCKPRKSSTVTALAA